MSPRKELLMGGFQDMGPILILCSTNDELAPINTIQNFAKSARERGCQVTLVVWDTSEHVGEFPKIFLLHIFAWMHFGQSHAHSEA
jgi:acetyl esterase/lipase